MKKCKCGLSDSYPQYINDIDWAMIPGIENVNWQNKLVKLKIMCYDALKNKSIVYPYTAKNINDILDSVGASEYRTGKKACDNNVVIAADLLSTFQSSKRAWTMTQKQIQQVLAWRNKYVCNGGKQSEDVKVPDVVLPDDKKTDTTKKTTGSSTNTKKDTTPIATPSATADVKQGGVWEEYKVPIMMAGVAVVGLVIYNSNAKNSHVFAASELYGRNYTSIRMSEKWRNIVGDLPKEQWTMLIHGIAGSGKSTYALKLSNELTKISPVLYGNFEEMVGKSLSNKLQTAKVKSNRIYFLKENSEDEFWRQLKQGQYRYAVIDSLSQITNDRNVLLFWDKIRMHPQTSFIVISHALKSKDGKSETNYRGASTLGHIVDINQRVANGIVKNEKNRFFNRNVKKVNGYKIF